MEYSEIAFFLGRILYGGYFVMMGINHYMKTEWLAQYAASKKVPSPRLAVLGSGALLLFGGLGILFWVYVEWAAIALLLFLLPVSFKMHNFWAVSDPNMKMADMINFMKNMALIGAALLLYAVAPGL